MIHYTSMQKTLMIGALAAALIIGGVTYAMRSEEDPAVVSLAQCLAEKGVIEYGAYWCPNCQAQEELFGRAYKHIKYVECAMPGNARAQAPKCRDAGITGYPTWVFPNGERLVGLQSLEALGKQAGCTFFVAPQN